MSWESKADVVVFYFLFVQKKKKKKRSLKPATASLNMKNSSTVTESI